MSLRRFISKLLPIGAPRGSKVSRDIAPWRVEWPLPDALPVGPSKPAGRATADGRHAHSERTGIQVYAYPFNEPEAAGIVPTNWSSPEAGDATDGKYCEVLSKDGTTRYIACRAFVEALQQAEGAAGRGLARLRLVALDRFGYTDEAQALFREFEGELGPPMAAMGFARVLLGNHHPGRALEVVESARLRGIAGAALDACHARMSFECGFPTDGVRMAAEALRSSPDPLWMAADHFYTWGLLHGAALASRADSRLKEEVLSAIRALCEGVHSAKRALACASLAEAAGDISAAVRYAADAAQLAQGDNEVLPEAASALERLRGLPALTSRLSQPPTWLDTRRVRLNMEGWSLDEAGSNPARCTWQDGDGNELILTAAEALDGTDIYDVGALRTYCRRLAESNDAGLVEATIVQGQLGLTVQLIYKKLEKPAFTFTGVQVIPLPMASLTWAVVCSEKGTTGDREAVVTAALMMQGQLTLEAYKESWACDPYDPLYRGVERSTLRYISDDSSYDAQFPRHPLSQVRRLLRELLRHPDFSMMPNSPMQPTGSAAG